ncbi:hypothetical protein SAY86_024408 [Trapa natans]|uniref:Uncharacterized protein n=1 Tax=Trapa natans TaxID=22666 RepID=A0AAN7MUE5_TRANT|nr:hypothetical protein SAY86_024408 [Trapa natans]
MIGTGLSLVNSNSKKRNLCYYTYKKGTFDSKAPKFSLSWIYDFTESAHHSNDWQKVYNGNIPWRSLPSLKPSHPNAHHPFNQNLTRFFSLGLHLLLHPPDSEHASHISLISPHLTMVRRTLRRQFNRDQLVNLPRDPNKKSTMARQFKQVNYGLEVAPAQIIHPNKPSNSPGLETIHEEGAEGFDEDA